MQHVLDVFCQVPINLDLLHVCMVLTIIEAWADTTRAAGRGDAKRGQGTQAIRLAARLDACACLRHAMPAKANINLFIPLVRQRLLQEAGPTHPSARRHSGPTVAKQN